MELLGGAGICVVRVLHYGSTSEKITENSKLVAVMVRLKF